jgi:hypothetical protein
MTLRSDLLHNVRSVRIIKVIGGIFERRFRSNYFMTTVEYFMALLRLCEMYEPFIFIYKKQAQKNTSKLIAICIRNFLRKNYAS